MVSDVVLLVCFVAGLALVAAGAWTVAPAAGLVVAGVELAGASYAYTRGGNE